MHLKNFMMLVLSVLLVIGVVLTGGCAPSKIETPATPRSAVSTPTTIIENITPQVAHALIQENADNPDFVILDVRTPEEFAGGHIENAINLDFYSPTFRAELDKLNKQKTYLVYCRTGGRSSSAVTILEELKFTKIYNMLEGIVGWGAGGLPTVK